MPIFLQILLTGLAIGISVAAPTGPVNILFIHRTLSGGALAGMAAGLGAVAGDSLLAAVAAFSVTAVINAMSFYSTQIQLIGSLVLMAFGIRLLIHEPDIPVPAAAARPLGAHYKIAPQTFLLTVSNPGAVLGMLAMVGGVASAIHVETYAHAGTLVLGVALGSLLWWILLGRIIAIVRHRLTQSRLKLINRISGGILLLFGALLLLDLLLPGGL